MNYAASKAGVEGLTRTCAKELAKYVAVYVAVSPAKKHILIASSHPGEAVILLVAA